MKGDGMTLSEKLVAVQSAIKAPKDKNNDFGGYKYRSAEQIFEAFKPYGKEYGLLLTVSDEIVLVGTWVYVKATATLADMASPADKVIVTAYAREQETKRGIDTAQVTGACSSYARKYALNGLFLLDDTKDPDTNEYKMESDKRAEEEEDRRKREEAEKRKLLIEQIESMAAAKGYSVKDIESASTATLAATVTKLENAPKKGGNK